VEGGVLRESDQEKHHEHDLVILSCMKSERKKGVTGVGGENIALRPDG